MVLLKLPPFILTLKLNSTAFAFLNDLRRRHFPPERNFIPAHITLFHQLPAEQGPAIGQLLQEICAKTAVLHLSLPELRYLGKGVAVAVDSPELTRLRGRLASVWSAWLSAQDRQGYRPHVTIQNKVAPDKARRLYERLAAAWEPFPACGEGVLLWRYLGGPWELVQDFPFAGDDNRVV